MLIEYPLKIVIVDDQEDILDIMESFLEDLPDFEIYKFTDPLKALEFIKNSDVSIAIVDILMKQMYGDDFLRVTKGLEKGIETIVVTGGPSLINLQTCFRNGARGILHKPFTQSDLLETVNLCKESIDCWNKSYQDLINYKTK